MRRLFSLVLFAVVLLALGGCRAKQAPYESYGYDYAMEEMDAPPPPAPPGAMDYEGASMPAASTRATTSAGASAKKPGAPRPAAQGGAPAPEPVEPAPEEKPSTPRMIHYNGYARLQATKTEELVDRVAKLAVEVGGFVEQLAPSRVTIRVPVERFDESFQRVLGLADVLDKAVTAEDVTDAFLAVDLRLSTSRAARDRLVALLASAKTEQEKLEILAQIRRLSEEIDVLEAQLRTISALASLSRITVEVVARPAFASQAPGQDPVGFAWIHQLSPFRRDVAAGGELAKLDVPTGFVALDLKKRFIAESADGAVIWSAKLDNEPEGDAAFWVSALKQRLGPEFQSAEVQSRGAFQVIRFVSETDDPYRYLVGVRVEGEHLYLVEVYYPSPEVEKRYEEAVNQVIAGGQS